MAYKLADIIRGDRFIDVGDMVFTPSCVAPDDWNVAPNTFSMDALCHGTIIYTHTMYVTELFKLLRHSSKQVIVVSHNSDVNIDDKFIVPENVMKWYTQNVNVVNPKIHSIPIGLENLRWWQHIGKVGLMRKVLYQPLRYANAAYMNHNVLNNVAERQLLYDLFEDQPWVTIVHGKNGEDFSDYITNVYNHPFVFCPNGNGIDTHRLWETLYMGSIPIVKKNINNSFYSSLPILFVDAWEDITEDLLATAYIDIGLGSYDNEMLAFSYWRNLITQR
jgi:hypothetical protein